MANIYNRQWATEKEGERRRERYREEKKDRGWNFEGKELGSDLIEMLPRPITDLCFRIAPFLLGLIKVVWICTSLSSEEVEDPAGLAPAELVPGLHQALVLGVLPQAPDLVALPVAGKKHIQSAEEINNNVYNQQIIHGDPSGRLKPPVHLLPTALAAAGPPQAHSSYLLSRQDGKSSQIQVNGRF